MTREAVTHAPRAQLTAAVLAFVSVPHSATMDAVTLVAAAVAIAVDHARNAALEDCLLDRERQAMRAAHLESRIAHEHYVRSAMLPPSAHPQGRLQTWREAYYEVEAEYDQALDAMRGMRIANNDGDADGIRQLLAQELGPSSSEEEAETSDQEAQRSDASEAEDQEAQPVQRCARCGSTRNLELLLPTGRWANAPMEQRLFCDACIEAAETP